MTVTSPCWLCIMHGNGMAPTPFPSAHCESRCLWRKESHPPGGPITTRPHPLSPLPSGRRLQSPWTKTSRRKDSFFNPTIRMLDPLLWPHSPWLPPHPWYWATDSAYAHTHLRNCMQNLNPAPLHYSALIHTYTSYTSHGNVYMFALLNCIF